MKTRYNIIRRQMTPPGKDKVVQQVDSETYPKALLLEIAEAAANVRKDVDHISDERLRVSLIGQPAGTGDKYSPTSVMVVFEAEPDRDQIIPVEEAADAIRDMIAFGAENGTHLAATTSSLDGSYVEVSLAREYNFVKGKPQRFRFRVETVE